MKVTPEEFRLRVFGKIASGEKTLAFLTENGLAKRLNIIFDIDHTLIYAI